MAQDTSRTSLKPLMLWGATGQALVLGEFCREIGFDLVALFDRRSDLKSPVSGVPLGVGEAGFLEWKARWHGEMHGAVAIGGEWGRDRLSVSEFLRGHGIRIVSLIHPRAFVASDAVLGEGVQILAHATVASRARIESGSIVNHGATIDHECHIGAGVHVAPGATLCGLVQVGTASMVGAGSVILPRVRIGADSIVGAGSVVTRDIPDNVIAFGNPATIIRVRPPVT